MVEMTGRVVSRIYHGVNTQITVELRGGRNDLHVFFKTFRCFFYNCKCFGKNIVEGFFNFFIAVFF